MNLIDFAYLAGYWELNDCGGADDCGQADMDASDDVGLGDLSALAANWLEGITE